MGSEYHLVFEVKQVIPVKTRVSRLSPESSFIGELAQTKTSNKKQQFTITTVGTSKHLRDSFFFSADSSSVSPYSKPVQGQHFSSSYQAVAQQRHSSGLITSYRRPPAVPVRSKVSENQPAGPHFLRAAQRVLGNSLT